ncbi:inactive beta-amylase 4, chloroplastic-like isoform X2 [Raphanus sativus]|uniref:Beta-amylase n=1 Tax=Raphanus sativus TaxID=3726 RepID=A0A9W3DBA3_RAPSA|nr:inactive beta-amylase 4, chloroplastic-like isoform X2 [Raphanus sativus]
MAEIGGIGCGCRGVSGGNFFFHPVGGRFSLKTCFLQQRTRRNRNFFRNLSIAPSFKRGGRLITKWSSVAGNSPIFSMDAGEKSRSFVLVSSRHKKVPVYVMMPIDTFGIDSSGCPIIKRLKALTVSLKALKLAGVHGVAVEVWWGIVERFSPLEFKWSLYDELFRLVSEAGLKLHVALCFHSNMHLFRGKGGGVSLPLWIREIGDVNKDIYYRDKNGFSNNDYLTLGVDQLPLFGGRTAVQCYEDFMLSFSKNFEPYFGNLIEEISIGLGPSGELRYPAHPLGDGRWTFPGIGEFQCHDKYMMEDLMAVASREGKPQWGSRDLPNAGCYNSFPSEVPFFEEGHDSFLSDYGRFFLEWYSGKLICHADAILAKAADVLRRRQEEEKSSVMLVAKIGGIYWWYKTSSHPAELTAGYYNTALRDGYDPLASVLSRHGAALHIPCLDMADSETPEKYLCSPEGLLKQIHDVSKKRTIQVTGRNTSERFDVVRDGTKANTRELCAAEWGNCKIVYIFQNEREDL